MRGSSAKEVVLTVLEMVPKLTAKVVTYGVIGTMIRCSFATR